VRRSRGACLITNWLVTSLLLPRMYSLSGDDDLLGGMWAVLAMTFAWVTFDQRVSVVS
jgi:hypothetical protein